MMAIGDGAEPAGRPRHDDVTITIRGETAAQILARGDAKVRELEELVRALGVKLDGLEAAMRQRAQENEALDRLVQALDGKLAALGGQVSDQLMDLRGDLARLREEAGDLGRLRDEIGGHGDKLARLQHKVESLAMTVEGTKQRADDGQAGAGDGGGDASPRQGAEGSPGGAPGSGGGVGGFFTSTADRLRQFNLWSVAGAAVALAAATGAAFWMYA